MHLSINTAQNVNIVCQPAGLAYRICATLLDSICMTGIFLLVSYLSTITNVYFMYITLILLLCYHLLFEYLAKGQSPGKMMCRIRVVRLDGQKLSFGIACCAGHCASSILVPVWESLP